MHAASNARLQEGVPQAPLPLLVSVSAAARLLGLSPATVRRLIREGRLDAKKIRGRRLIPTTALLRLAQ